MIRQTVRSMALFAAGLLLAGGAWGQSLVQTTSAVVTVAAEYFGAAAGREIQASKFDLDATSADTTERPYVQLAVTGEAITSGNVANITFTMGGATFSQTVAPANLDLRGATCHTDKAAGLSVSVDSGGAKGDSSVTFRVEASDSDGLAAGTETICFWVPDLMATLTTVVPAMPPTPAVMGVTATASITQGVTNNNPFPALINGPLFDHDMDGGTTPEILNPMIPGASKELFRAAVAMDTNLGMGETALVALADRTKIMAGSGTPDPTAKDPNTAARGLKVGSLMVAVSAGATAGTIMKLDGSGPVYDATEMELDSSLGGQIMLMIGGRYGDGDKVVVGTGSTARTLTPEGMMASSALALTLTAGTDIVYVPGGTDTLRPTTFAAGAKYSFNNPDNNNGLAIKGSTGRIDYAGINVEGYAYGVVRGGGMESSVIRATCEAASGMCQVFADCTDQDGMSYFGGPVPIAAGATGVVDSDDIAGALGGGWDSGRGRCDIYSTAPLAVQHMVRSGHTLINNSTVVGRGLDEQTDDMHADSIEDICESVGMTLDTTNDSPDTTYETVCAPVDTTP